MGTCIGTDRFVNQVQGLYNPSKPNLDSNFSSSETKVITDPSPSTSMSQNMKSEDGRSASSGSTTDQSTAGGSDVYSPSPSFVPGQMFGAISLASIIGDESAPRTMTEEDHFRSFGSEAEAGSWTHGAFLPSSDHYIHMKIWDDLAAQIQIFVKLVFPPKCIWSLVEDDIKAQLLAISPRAADFCEDPEYKGCWLLFGAWIWRILYENLFSLNCRDKWSGSDWTTFGCLRESLGGMFSFPFHNHSQPAPKLEHG